MPNPQNLLCCVLTGCLLSGCAAKPPPLAIKVVDNHLADGAGHTVRLLGVNLSGQYLCTGAFPDIGVGIFDGPSDNQSISLMKAWHINAVRIQLNESCWLGINGPDPNYSGNNYRRTMLDYVNRLHQYGLYVILDLNYNAPGNHLAITWQAGPDADHAPDLWASVAATFRDDRAVLFDLYNEPIHDLFASAADKWACWRDGCDATVYYDGTYSTVPPYDPQYVPLNWPMAGMQALIDRIRGANAHQPVLLGGLSWASDLGNPADGWLTHQPTDPDRQIIASAHVYDFGLLHDPADWERSYTPVVQSYPLVAGEIGQSNTAHAFMDSYMAWADAHGVSYLGWAWIVFHPDPTQSSPPTDPTLILDYGDPLHPLIPNGNQPTPSVMGQAFRDHLLQVGYP